MILYDYTIYIYYIYMWIMVIAQIVALLVDG
jgi:hypothetical protein